MERPRGIQFLYELNLFTGTDIGRLFPLRADIWSFGITALELAHVMDMLLFKIFPNEGASILQLHDLFVYFKILLMTLQNARPGLDYDRDKKLSKNRVTYFTMPQGSFTNPNSRLHQSLSRSSPLFVSKP
ncbi:hypothetical protein L1987_77750 [Smallanthus sonchifolius]|uniref:Uncharacterized protein n=1 Tax=Smallanthus sonchifolius TaxID=185202 RepID=A0ACB8ZBU5_9ASTR|nr:hypothetical protein L1987_77750 [Smallanthus sonchifolius]